MNREMTTIDVDKVIIKENLRSDMGDLATLESSISRLGVLHPIIIDRKNVLLVGGRRLQACRNLSLTSVPAIRANTEFGSMESLEIQADENLCRCPISPEDLEQHIARKKRALGGDRNRPGVLSGIKRLFGGDKSKQE